MHQSLTIRYINIYVTIHRSFLLDVFKFQSHVSRMAPFYLPVMSFQLPVLLMGQAGTLIRHIRVAGVKYPWLPHGGSWMPQLRHSAHRSPSARVKNP